MKKAEKNMEIIKGGRERETIEHSANSWHYMISHEGAILYKEYHNYCRNSQVSTRSINAAS